MNLVVAGTETAVLMVESEALELPEDVMLGGVVFGHTQMQAAINAINELVEVAGKPEWDWQAPAKNEALIARVTEIASAKIDEAFRITAKQARSQQLSAIGKEVHETLVAEGVSTTPTPSTTSSSISKPRLFVAASSAASRVSMVVTPVPCARSTSVSACCRVPTVPPCSPAVRPRPWW
jgi:polyribonucleotide nucleotidyltransferase